ncbi:MAG: AI-2E family transporter [Pirellulaceae bacterium]
MNQDGLSVKRLTEEQSWLQTGALLVLAIVAFSFALSYAGSVLIPFTLALFLNYLVAPIVDFQMIRLKFSKFIAVTMALLIVVLVLFLLSSLLLMVLQNISQGSANVAFYGKFKEKVEVPLSYVFELVESIAGNNGEESDSNVVPVPQLPEHDAPPLIKQDDLPEPMASVESPEQDESTTTAALELPDSEPSDGNEDPRETDPAPENDSPDDDPPGEPTATSATDDDLGETDLTVEEEKPALGFFLTPEKPSEKQIDRTRQFMDWFLYETQREAPELLRYFGGTLLNLLSSVVLTSIFVGFMLAGRNPYKVSKGIYAEIDRKVRRYITTKFFISAVTGVLVWLTLEIIGLRFASMFGLMAFCLNFIPSVGSIVSTLLPIPIAFVEFDSWFWIAIVILVPGTIQMVIGNVIEPKVMGDGLQLHPVTILLGLTFFALLWGPVGMLLAAPITATIRIVMMRFHTTEPIGNLMAGILPEEADEHDADGPVPAS